MVDLSQLSDEDLQALSEGNMQGLSDSALESIANTPSKDWNLLGSLKNFGAGAVETVTQLPALALDLSGVAPLASNISDIVTGKAFDLSSKPAGVLDLPASKEVAAIEKPLLPAEDPNYRYARTLGRFAPSAGIGPGGLLTRVLGAVVPAVGAQAAEDATGDKHIAPLIAAVAGGGVVNAITGTVKNLLSILRGATSEEIKGSAALAMNELTGLTPNEIAAGIAQRGTDPASSLQTTAEVTGNAPMAQIEKNLGGMPAYSGAYATRYDARNAARTEMLDAMSDVPGINREGLGSALMTQAEQTQIAMSKDAQEAWDKFPRLVPVNVAPEQATVRAIIEGQMGGLPPDSATRKLVDQFLGEGAEAQQGGLKMSFRFPNAGTPPSATQLSGTLQGIRSSALKKLRSDPNLDPIEERALSAITSGVDTAFARELTGDNYKAWRAAADATKAEAGTFGRGSAGGSLVAETARPSNALANAFKGDSQSIMELKAAIRNDPQLLEGVKRGVLEMIPRDVQGNLTASGVKKFISANEGAIRELLGQSHLDSLNTIADDLASQAGVQKLANLASEAGSSTQQKQTVAGIIEDTVAGSVLPGTGGFWGKIIENFKGAAGVKNRQGIQNLLFRAAMSPEFALELSKAPTTTRILNAMDRLKELAINTGLGAAKAGASDLLRPPSAGASPKQSTQSQPKGTPQAQKAKVDLSGYSNQAPSGSGQSPATSNPIDRSVSQGATPYTDPRQSQNITEGYAAKASPVALTQAPAEFSYNSGTSQQSSLLNLLSRTTGKTVDLKQVKAVIASDPVDQATMMLESSGDPNAKNSDSTASGLFQLLKKTAKALGVKDVFDPEQNYRGYLKLKQEAAPFVEKPEDYYAYHYLGGLTFKAWKAGAELDEKQQAQVAELTADLLPEWRKYYAEAVAKLSGSVQA